VNEGVPSARGATTFAADARFSETGTSATGTLRRGIKGSGRPRPDYRFGQNQWLIERFQEGLDGAYPNGARVTDSLP